MANNRNTTIESKIRDNKEWPGTAAFQDLKNGRFKEALLKFRELKKIKEYALQATTGEAKCYVKLREFDKAIELLKPLIGKKKTSSRNYSLLANAYVGLEQYAEALRILNLCPYQNDFDINYAKINCLAYIDTQKSFDLFNKMPATKETALDLAILKAHILHYSGDIQAEQQHYLAALELFPNNLKLKESLAKSLFKANDYDKAEILVLECLEKERNNLKFKEILQRIRYHRNKASGLDVGSEDLMNRAKKLLDEIENEVPVKLNKAKRILIELIDNKQYKLALKINDLLLQIFPNDMDLEVNYVNYYLGLEQFDKMFEHIQSLFEKYSNIPANKQIFIARKLNNLYLKTKEQKFKVRGIEILKELIPNTEGEDKIAAQLALVKSYNCNRQYHKAVEVLAPMVKEHPDLWRIHVTYGITCDNADDQEESMKTLKNICKAYKSKDKNIRKPTSQQYSTALHALAVLYSKEPYINPAKEKKYAEKAKAMDRSNDSAVAQLAHRKDDRNKRFEKFQQAYAINPERLDINHAPVPAVVNVGVIKEKPSANVSEKIASVQKSEPVKEPFSWNKPPSLPGLVKDEKNYPSLGKQNVFEEKQRSEIKGEPKQTPPKMNPNAAAFVPGGKK